MKGLSRYLAMCAKTSEDCRRSLDGVNKEAGNACRVQIELNASPQPDQSHVGKAAFTELVKSDVTE